MKEFKFNKNKNDKLKIDRSIDFETVIKKIKNNRKTKAIKHPNQKKYPKQRIFLVKIKERIYAVPFIEEDEYIFLKTIYPSEKYTKKLLKIKKQI